MTDWELLSRYRAGSEEAFAELMARHVDWVYSAALRRVRDPHRAQDVTQATFIALAEGGNIRQGAIVSAWLFRVMRYAAANSIRAEGRRKRHESAAGRLRPESSNEARWDELAPLLDEAVAALGRKDCEAVLLRFYERKSLAEVGGALGISEEGARKRVSRAVGKLRRYFAARGCTTATLSLTACLATETVAPAPGQLLIARLTPSEGSAGLAREALGMIRRTRLLRTMIAALGMSAATAAVVGIGILILGDGGRAKAISASAPPAFVTPGATTLPATRPTTFTIEQIIAGIRNAEKAYTNLYIKDFRTTADTLAAGQTLWTSTPMLYTGSAWYDEEPNGKVRIYFAENVLPWEPFPGERPRPGQVPWAGQEVDFSWDGKEGREVHVTNGLPGKNKRRDNSAMLTPDRSMFLGGYSRYQTGTGFTLQYQVTIEEMTTPPRKRLALSEGFEKWVKGNYLPELSEQSVNGIDTVRMRWTGPGGRASDTWWLAPSRGFALVKHETVMNFPNDSRTEGIEVSELKEVLPGVWFPMRANMIMRQWDKRGAYLRYNYTAADVVANDLKFDPGIFSATIPIGYIVGDTRGKRRDYIIPQEGEEQELRKGDILPSIKPSKPRRPDAKD